jgi:hypothetical protein
VDFELRIEKAGSSLNKVDYKRIDVGVSSFPKDESGLRMIASQGLFFCFWISANAPTVGPADPYRLIPCRGLPPEEFSLDG